MNATEIIDLMISSEITLEKLRRVHAILAAQFSKPGHGLPYASVWLTPARKHRINAHLGRRGLLR